MVTATVIRVAAGTTVPHVLARRWSMRAISDRVVHTDATTVQVDSIEFLNASSSIFNGRHFYETKSPRAIRPLVVNDGHFFNSAETTKLFVQVALLGANAEPEDTQHIGRIGRLLGNWGVRGSPGGRRRPPTIRGTTITCIVIAASAGAARTRASA